MFFFFCFCFFLFGPTSVTLSLTTFPITHYNSVILNSSVSITLQALHFCAFASLVSSAKTLFLLYHFYHSLFKSMTKRCLLLATLFRSPMLFSSYHIILLYCLQHICHHLLLFIVYLHLHFEFYERRGLVCLGHCFIPDV